MEIVDKIKKAAPLIVLIVLLIIFMFGYEFYAYKKSDAFGTATLSWNANTEADLAGYKIYYGTSPRTGDCPLGDYPNKIDIGKTATTDKPSYKIENLEEGKIYYFSITSYDTFGNESCFSEEMSKNIKKEK